MIGNYRWIAPWLALSVALAACAGRPAPGSIKVAGPETVTGLAYNPDDFSLLKTDAAGLSRFDSEEKVWKPVNTLVVSGLTGVVVNPDSPNILYVGGLGTGVLKSIDGGESWSEVNHGLPNQDITALTIHSVRRETLYAWVRGGGVYRTEDGGQNWKRMPDSLQPFTEAATLVHSTLPGSMNTGWLYASTAEGAYLSMDCF